MPCYICQVSPQHRNSRSFVESRLGAHLWAVAQTSHRTAQGRKLRGRSPVNLQWVSKKCATSPSTHYSLGHFGNESFQSITGQRDALARDKNKSKLNTSLFYTDTRQRRSQLRVSSDHPSKNCFLLRCHKRQLNDALSIVCLESVPCLPLGSVRFGYFVFHLPVRLSESVQVIGLRNDR